jgi:hypothetical protein
MPYLKQKNTLPVLPKFHQHCLLLQGLSPNIKGLYLPILSILQMAELAMVADSVIFYPLYENIGPNGCKLASEIRLNFELWGQYKAVKVQHLLVTWGGGGANFKINKK